MAPCLWRYIASPLMICAKNRKQSLLICGLIKYQERNISSFFAKAQILSVKRKLSFPFRPVRLCKNFKCRGIGLGKGFSIGPSFKKKSKFMFVLKNKNKIKENNKSLLLHT